EAACEAFCEQVNTRVHRVTRRVPAEALAEEQARLHPLPAQPFTLAFGQTRTVASTTPMIDYQTGQYSVPHQLRGEVVWVREHGEEIVVVHVGPTGPVEVARHARTIPGSPRLDDAHFGPRPTGPLARSPRARTQAEAEFLAIGDGAGLWLTEAAGVGASRVRAKPPLPDELDALLRRLRLPHIRRAAPEVLATARAQRWAPAEVLRALLGEEAAGRERSSRATRRASAAFPTGKTFAAWDEQA